MAEFTDTIWQAVAGMLLARGVPVPTGQRLYVDENSGDAADDADHGKNPDATLLTINYARGLCNSNKGDVIIVSPNHNETIPSAGALALSVEGITLIGLGNGDNRPTITFSGNTGGDIDITADNVTVMGFRFLNSEDASTGPIHVAAAYFRCVDCEFEDSGTTNTVDWIVLSTGANDFLLQDLINKGTDTGGNQSFINIVAAVDHGRIVRVFSNGDFASANIDLDAAATDLTIEDCDLESANAADCNIAGYAAATGKIRRCDFRIATDGQASWVKTPGYMTVYDCWGASANGEQAVPVTTAATEELNAMIAPCLAATGKPVPCGKRIWLHSGTGTDAAGYGHRPEMPVATLDYANNLCTANKGDLILGMPGHAETIAAAADADLDCEGVTFLGLGNGDNIPTLTFDTSTGADLDFGADNVTICNVRFANNLDNMIAPIDVNAAYGAIVGCEFEDLGTDVTLDWITLSTGTSDFLLKDIVHKGHDTADGQSFITANVASDHCRIINLVSNGQFAKGCIDFSDVAMTDVLIEDCKLENDNETADRCIYGNAAMTGWVVRTYMFITADAETTWFETPGKTGTFECYGVNDDGEAGKFVGAVSV